MPPTRSIIALIPASIIAITIATTTLAQQSSFPSLDQDNSTRNQALLLASSNPPVPPSVSPSLPTPAPAAATPGVRPISPVKTSIEVNAFDRTLSQEPAAPLHMTQSEILSSAGTFGDFTRYLQLMPGVVWNTDQSNDVLVRGGHPSENLYVIDGIEIPNLNHIAAEGTTGGFTSMVDTATISSIDMKAGVYDAKYSSRLSSLIEIQTRANGGKNNAGEVNFGIAGAGGFLQRALSPRSTLLLSGHRSVLNLITTNIGLDGTPIYTNGMAQLQWSPGEHDRISALSLNGADSIDISPCAGDVQESLDIDTQYAGWRSTDGLVWQHTHSPATVSTLTGSFSTQSQNIGQQQQATGGSFTNYNPDNHCQALVVNPVYREQTSDGISSLGYTLQFVRHGWLTTFGATGRVTRLDYNIAQPVGEQSPFNPNPTWSDATTVNRLFNTGQAAAFAEATGHFAGRWALMAGVREENFALSNTLRFDPRASLAYRISQHQAANVSYGRSSQLAPYIQLLSYAQNASLRPLQVEQFSAGADLWRASWFTATVEAYRKLYSDEPVSTEYPSLMLANMVDTLGQQFVWLPLKSGGRGESQGLELLLRTRWSSRIHMLASGTYSRTRYAASDGVMRPGNFDFPVVANGMATLRLPGTVQLSLRDSYASGRPYTPFDIPLSRKQFRGIYDLTRVNALHGPSYNRLDLEADRAFHIPRGLLDLHGGVDNALDRANFLGYAWLDRCPAKQNCSSLGAPMVKLSQMPIFPTAGLRFEF